MKKIFSKTVAALLSVTCMGSVMTASFNGRPLFTPKLIAKASSGVSFDEETGVLTLYGNIENMFALANYSGDKRVKEVKALKGTVLPADCTKLFCRLEAEKIDISNADTSHVTNMSDMFSCCSNLKYLNIDNIDTSNVTNMNQTFYACPNLKSINLQSFNTSNVTDMMNMFNQCSSLETLDLRGFNTSNVTNMACMFSSCTNLNSIDMSTWNTCNLEHMNGMFQGCQNLKSLDFESFNTKELKSFNYVFSGCEKLEKIKFGDFDISNITNMDYLFFGCSSIPLLDLSSFDTSKVTTMLHMFDDCQSLETIYVSDKWTTASLDFSHWTSIEYDRFMFFSCKNLKGGNGTGYDFNKTRSIMACIDTKETPGYLTYKKHFSTPTINDGIYVLESAVKPNMVADVDSYEKNGTRNLQLYERNNSNSQKFKIKSAYNGYYTIHLADNDSKVISVEGNTGSPGSNVSIRKNNLANNQLWFFESAGNGYYYIKSKTGNYLDVSGGYNVNKTNIQLYLGNETFAQRWKLIRINNGEKPSENDNSNDNSKPSDNNKPKDDNTDNSNPTSDNTNDADGVRYVKPTGNIQEDINLCNQTNSLQEAVMGANYCTLNSNNTFLFKFIPDETQLYSIYPVNKDYPLNIEIYQDDNNEYNTVPPSFGKYIYQLNKKTTYYARIYFTEAINNGFVRSNINMLIMSHKDDKVEEINDALLDDSNFPYQITPEDKDKDNNYLIGKYVPRKDLKIDNNKLYLFKVNPQKDEFFVFDVIANSDNTSIHVYKNDKSYTEIEKTEEDNDYLLEKNTEYIIGVFTNSDSVDGNEFYIRQNNWKYVEFCASYSYTYDPFGSHQEYNVTCITAKGLYHLLEYPEKKYRLNTEFDESRYMEKMNTSDGTKSFSDVRYNSCKDWAEDLQMNQDEAEKIFNDIVQEIGISTSVIGLILITAGPEIGAVVTITGGVCSVLTLFSPIAQTDLIDALYYGKGNIEITDYDLSTPARISGGVSTRAYDPWEEQHYINKFQSGRQCDITVYDLYELTQQTDGKWTMRLLDPIK